MQSATHVALIRIVNDGSVPRAGQEGVAREWQRLQRNDLLMSVVNSKATMQNLKAVTKVQKAAPCRKILIKRFNDIVSSLFRGLSC